ncbi:MAG: hypothetical protein ACT4OX_04460 [Actinomycetota bacterium]
MRDDQQARHRPQATGVPSAGRASAQEVGRERVSRIEGFDRKLGQRDVEGSAERRDRREHRQLTRGCADAQGEYDAGIRGHPFGQQLDARIRTDLVEQLDEDPLAVAIAIAREAWFFALVLAFVAIDAALFGFARPSIMALGARLLCIGNFVWAAAVALALAAGAADGVDAWLLAATIPYTLALGALQWRALAREDLRSALLVS